MTTTHPHPSRRELAHRSSNGTDVHLLWSPTTNTLAVTVHDPTGDSFELNVDPTEALDTFHHPYAHAAFRGLHTTRTHLQTTT